MSTLSLEYSGDLRCQLQHEASGMQIETDAPLDNCGRGENFSPTDLLAAALGSCMMTIMGIVAQKYGIDLKGTKLSVLKIMSSDAPRRVVRLEVTMTVPLPADHPQRAFLEQAALSCPVAKSLHADIEQVVTFHWLGM